MQGLIVLIKQKKRMRNKQIFTVHTLVLDKGESFEVPNNTVKYAIHINDEYLEDFYRDYINVDFRKEKLIIFFIDPNRRKKKCDAIFNIIQDVSKITKKQIKSKCQKEEMVLARQLFHYGFMKSNVGTLVEAGEETNNDHTTVLYSIGIIENYIEVGNGWRKNICLKFIELLTIKNKKQ